MQSILRTSEQTYSSKMSADRDRSSNHNSGERGSNLIPSGKPTVFVIDDDISVRESLRELISAKGWETEIFTSAQDFLSFPRKTVPSCLVLDISLPGISGLDLQKRLSSDGVKIPIIFITGFGDIPMTVRAMKAGAVEFLTKPFSHEDLFSAITQALSHSLSTLDHDVQLRELRDRHRSLSRREQEVMALAVSGLLNKQIGFELDISEITVKAHRGKVMRKMRAKSFADLVNMAAKLRVSPRSGS
jgi:FixJ family two-component response regulator